MQSLQCQRQSNVPLRPMIWLVAAVLIGATAAGCGGGSSASADGGTGGKKDSGAGTGGVSGADARKLDSSSAEAGTGNPNLGTACTSDAECGAGFTCWTQTDTVLGGGAPHGYCSTACSMTDSAACMAANGVCLIDPTSKKGWCTLPCAQGGDANTSKCHDRTDVACVPFFDANGNVTDSTCIPTCSQNSDCPGSKCDERSGFCSATPHVGGAFGTHCTFDPNGVMDSCAGNCVPANSDNAGNVTASFCSRSCAFSSVNECDFVDKNTSAASGGPHGLCLPLLQNFGPNDLGYCYQLCDTTADCADQSDPQLTCDKTILPTLPHGICLWGVTSSTDGGVMDSGGQ